MKSKDRVSTRRHRISTWPFVLWAQMLLVLGSGMAGAQSATATFATRAGRGQSVLRVDALLDRTPAMSFGNLRVTISSPAAPCTADRNLTVVFYTQAIQNAEQHIAYSISAQLLEGQTQVVVDIPHPMAEGQTAWDVGLFEDGRDIEDRRGQASNAAEYQWSFDAQTAGNLVAFLVDSPQSIGEAQQYASLLSTQVDPQNSQVVLNGTIFTPGSVATAPTVNIVGLAEASDDWRRYLAYDVWVVSAETLASLNRSRSEVAQGLRHYVACGGKIFLHGATDKGELFRLLGIESTAIHPSQWTTIKQAGQPWWLGENDARDLDLVARRAAQAATTPAAAADAPLRPGGIAYDAFLAAESWAKWSLGNHVDNLRDLAEFLDAEPLSPTWIDSGRSYIVRQLETDAIAKLDYLNGSIFIASKPFSNLPWPLLEHLRATEFNGISRKVSPAQDGNWYWRNLISAVGKPPVWVFCGIVTLFGAALGPGLLLLTGRSKRRSLMIFLVPLLSMFATACIVLYGILHEGFSTNIRVVSVQCLDPATKQGFVWSRQNYFSGLPPREGLSFALQTYARAVMAEDNRYANSISPRSGVAYSVQLTDKQTWRGWLRARQQQQLLVGYPAENMKMPISIEPAGSTQVRVRNLTQSRLPLVALRGAGDDYYLCEELAAGDVQIVSARERVTVGANAARVFEAFKPDSPPELRIGGPMLNLGSRRGLGRAAQNNNTMDILNTVMDSHVSDHLAMPAFGFAVVRTEDERVVVPIRGQVDESLHIVTGVQPW